MLVDCQTCPVRVQRCGDCMVTAMFAPAASELPLDHAEQTAIGIFVEAGLVSLREADQLSARREPWGAFRAVG